MSSVDRERHVATSRTARAVTAVVAFVGVYGLTWTLCLLVLPEPLFAWLGLLVPIAAGAFAAHGVWRDGLAIPDGVGAGALRGAILLGSMGFVGGFFGPMLFAPDANQGPLLGLFVLGPGGALLGAALGALTAWSRA